MFFKGVCPKMAHRNQVVLRWQRSFLDSKNRRGHSGHQGSTRAKDGTMPFMGSILLMEHQTRYTETIAAVVCHLRLLQTGEDCAKMKAGPCKIEKKSHWRSQEKNNGNCSSTSQNRRSTHTWNVPIQDGAYVLQMGGSH